MNIMFDIDGTITNYDYWFTEVYKKYCKDKGITLQKVNTVSYCDSGKTNLSEEQLSEMLGTYGQTILFSRVRVGVRNLIRQLMISGHNVYIITARGFDEIYGFTGEEVEQKTVKWIAKEIGDVSGVFTHVKDKAKKCKELNITLAFEDCVEYINALNREGIRTIIVDTESNRSLQDIYRIYDFDKDTCDRIHKDFLYIDGIEESVSSK